MAITSMAGDLISSFYKAYIARSMVKDMNHFIKFVGKNVKDLDWDTDSWLHKAGLSTYTPIKSTLGGFSLLMLGACVGGIVALMWAPKPGMEMRTVIKDKALDMLGKVQMAVPPVTDISSARV